MAADDFQQFVTRHLDDIQLDFRPQALLDELLLSQVLEHKDTRISFKYKYYLYYFTARHLRDYLLAGRESVMIRGLINDLADNLYYEPYANILVFYLYLNRDVEAIEHVLANSRLIYSDQTPCDINRDLGFFNELDTSLPVRKLPSNRTSENRERILAQMDSDRLDGEQRRIRDRPEKVRYSDALHPYFKINIAFKTQQVLGQVLRNFPGSLPGDLKARITEECYDVGLRTLHALLKGLEADYSNFKECVEELIKDRRQLETDAVLPKSADRFLLWLTNACAFGIIRRISTSVGHPQLTRTYKAVLSKAEGNLSYALIDLAIKLDHLNDLPQPEIKALAYELRSNPFGFRVLQDLVFWYMCMFSLDFDVKQSLGTIVHIDTTSPKVFDSKRKILNGERKLSKRLS